MPGTGDLVRELHAGRRPAVGLTNWSDELYPHAPAAFDVLGAVRGRRRLRHRGGRQAGPGIYEIARRRAALPLGRLVFVDDRADNVAAAAEAGMDALLFTDAATLRADLRARGLPV